MNLGKLSRQSVTCFMALTLCACTAHTVTQDPEATSVNDTESVSRIVGLEWADGRDVLAQSIDLSTAQENTKDQVFSSSWSSEKLTKSGYTFVNLGLTATGKMIASRSSSRGIDKRRGI